MLVRICAGDCDYSDLDLQRHGDGSFSHPCLDNGKKLKLELVRSRRIMHFVCDLLCQRNVLYAGVEFDGNYALITEHSKPRFQYGPFNASNVAQHMQDLLRALQNFHYEGYVHGNLTIHNILEHGGFAGLGGIVEAHSKFANPGGSRVQDPLAQGGFRGICPQQDARGLLILLFELLLGQECTTTVQIGDLQYHTIQKNMKSDLESDLHDERLKPRILVIFEVMAAADESDISILKDVHQNPDTKYKPGGQHLEDYLQNYSPDWTTYLQNLCDTAEAHQSFIDRMWTALATAFPRLF